MDMRRKTTGLVASIIIAMASGCGVRSATDSQSDELRDVVFSEDNDAALSVLGHVVDELLVQPFPGADADELDALYADVGATVVGSLSDIDFVVLRVDPDRLTEVAELLGESGLIEIVQKNYLYETAETPNDPYYSRQTHLAQIRASTAWNTTVGDASVIIGIVDSGVDGDHPDLAGKILDGWNMFDSNTDFADVIGHGTLVAGVAAAASNNETGVAGVAWECPILPVRVSDAQGAASSEDLAAGILWAVGNGARVINVSFAPLWSNRIVQAASQQAYNRGALVVIAAGNGGGSTRNTGYSESLFVGAVATDDTLASFSDRGPFVDLAAPGTAIRSTERGGGYAMANGTSFAAPIVSGVAALMWSVNPNLRPVTIQELLIDSAVDLGRKGKDSSYGNGEVDAAAAVAQALKTEVSPDTTPPTLAISKPTNGASYSSRFRAAVSASDRYGVADVVMWVDGVPYATDSRSPYSFVINPASFAPGTYTFSFVATDLSGNLSGKDVRIRFRSSSQSSSNNGRITFSSPSSGATVSGNVTVRATVSDSSGLATVEWFVDGQSVFVSAVSGTSIGVSYLWRTSQVASGSHTITLLITDSLGNQGTADLNVSVR